MTAPAAPDAGDQPLADATAERELATFIGPRWTTYRKKFAPFLREPGFVPTWNWPAALMPFGVWFLYRKLYVPFVLFWLAPGLVRLLTPGTAVASPTKPDALTLGVALSIAIAAGGTGNYLLYRRAQAARELLRAQQLPAAQFEETLARIGGVNRSAAWVGVALFVLSVIAQFMSMRGG